MKSPSGSFLWRITMPIKRPVVESISQSSMLGIPPWRRPGRVCFLIGTIFCGNKGGRGINLVFRCFFGISNLYWLPDNVVTIVPLPSEAESGFDNGEVVISSKSSRAGCPFTIPVNVPSFNNSHWSICGILLLFFWEKKDKASIVVAVTKYSKTRTTISFCFVTISVPVFVLLV